MSLSASLWMVFIRVGLYIYASVTQSLRVSGWVYKSLLVKKITVIVVHRRMTLYTGKSSYGLCLLQHGQFFVAFGGRGV